MFFLISYVALTRLQKRFNKVPWAIVLAVFGIIWGIVQVRSRRQRGTAWRLKALFP